MIDLSWLGSAIDASASHVNALFNGLMSWGMQKKQNEYNRQMMQEMNEYNSPVNQSLRLMQAGLNPNLSYGSITPGIQSHPTEKGVPDFSEMQQNLSQAAHSAGRAVDRAYDAYITRKQMELQERNLELARKRLDNEIERTDIKRSLANVAIKKGDFQMAALQLDNRWKAMTMYDRVKSERWRQELLGYKTDTARAEATYAPDFYELRNQEARKRMWYLAQKSALGWANNKLASDKYKDWRKVTAFRETWSAYYRNEMIKATKERIAQQEELVKTAKDAETRKQREQVLHYLFKYMEDLENGVMDMAKIGLSVY